MLLWKYSDSKTQHQIQWEVNLASWSDSDSESHFWMSFTTSRFRWEELAPTLHCQIHPHPHMWASVPVDKDTDTARKG